MSTGVFWFRRWIFQSVQFLVGQLTFVPVFAFGYFSSPVTLAGAFVESLSQLATASPRYLAVHADVEILTILGVGVSWMRSRDRVVDLWTGEIEKFPGTAALLLGLVGPITDTGLLGEYQTIGTGDHIVLPLDAVIKRVAYTSVLVTEVTVHPWTVGRRLWFLQFRSLGAVDTER